MEPEPSREEMKKIFRGMWQQKNYSTTLQRALDTAREKAPMSTKIAVAIDTHLGGSLGCRSVRKQLQGLIHHACGNLRMRVNSTSSMPSTYFLPVCAFIGESKSPYYTFLHDIMSLLSEGIKEIEKQLFDANIDEQENMENRKDNDKNNFHPRQLLHGPGTKEG